MSPPPRVAVVATCFNDGHLLEEALSSVADQEAVELVIVDDGSTDATTLAVITRLKERDVRVIQQENTGLSGARMTGVRETTAPYIYPLDADDMIAPGGLAALADLLDANESAGVAWGDYETFGAKECRVPGGDDLDAWRITFIDEIPGTSLFRRAAILDVGGWDHDGYEDWDILMALAERGWRGVHAPRVVLRYRAHKDPRMYSSKLQRDEYWVAQIRARHPGLFRTRSHNRRLSTSPPVVRVLFTVISRLPFLTDVRKRQGYAAVRAVLQPHLRPSCFPGIGQIVARGTRSVLTKLVRIGRRRDERER